MVNTKLEPFKYPAVRRREAQIANGAHFYARKYLKHDNMELLRSGFHVDPNVPFMGCTPHRFVQVLDAPRADKPVKLLHVQCDQSEVPFAPLFADVTRAVCEMAITGVDSCDVMYFTPVDHVVFNIQMTQEKRLQWEEVIMPVAK